MRTHAIRQCYLKRVATVWVESNRQIKLTKRERYDEMPTWGLLLAARQQTGKERTMRCDAMRYDATQTGRESLQSALVHTGHRYHRLVWRLQAE